MMRFDDKLCDSIDARLGKEKLYLRAFETIKEHGDIQTYLRNIRSIYLGLMESKEVNKILGLNVPKTKEFKKRIASRYHKRFLNDYDPESDEYSDAINEQYDTMDRAEESFLTFQQRNSYSRGNEFQNPTLDEKFQKKVTHYDIESFVFNRLYEMMLTQLITKHLIDELGDKYFIKAYKTSTFDDTMSGIDIVISMRDKSTGYWSNVGIDHKCSISEKTIVEQGESNDALCGEFCSSIGNNRYKRMPRVIWNSNPGISFLLFEWYINELASGTMPNTETLQLNYFNIIENNPVLYQLSKERKLGLDNNVDNIKIALADNFNH